MKSANKFLNFLFLFLAFNSFFFKNNLNAQEQQINSNVHLQIQNCTNTIFDSLVSIRRDFHQNPETSGNEKETANKIVRYLTNLGIEVKTNIGGYGVIGILNGTKPGKTVIWRADIDAFATDFPDVVDYKSKIQGIRHICGHDVHTTIGLGIAKVMNTLKNQLCGTIIFLFQPAEESFKGAKNVLSNSEFKKIKADAVFGIHLAPMPTGLIAVKEKEMYWKGKTLRLELKNNTETDTMIKECVEKIRSLSTITEDSKYYDMVTLGDPELGLGSPNSIYANYYAMSKNLSITKSKNSTVITVQFESSSIENHENALLKLTNELKNSKWKDLVLSVSFINDLPTVYNNPHITQKSVEVIKKVYGEQNVVPVFGINPYNNDDFALLQEQIAGVYFFLGASDFSKGIISSPHSPNFAVDENAIKFGVNYFSSMLFEYTQTK